MKVDMITAQQARDKVHIDIMNRDMQICKNVIIRGIADNQAGNFLNLNYDIKRREGSESKMINAKATFTELIRLGYIIRVCPDFPHFYYIQWEEDPNKTEFQWEEIDLEKL